MAKIRARLLATILSLIAGGFARAGSPELADVQPVGVQRGTPAKLTLRGARLGGAQQLLFYEPGFTAAKVTNTSEAEATAECTVAPDCPLGEHHLRLRTSSGISELRTIWVGALPIVDEVEPNGDFAVPQKIVLNSTVHGVVTGEDIDYFAVDAKKGQSISAEIEALRLGRTMFDPAIAILNVKRFELAATDDSSLLLQDSAASIVAPEDGTYIISVREAAFGGNDQSFYRLHVGTFPRPLVAYPPAAPPGTTQKISLLGDPRGPVLHELSLPNAPRSASPIYGSNADGTSPSPVWMRISPLPSKSEGILAPTSQPVAPTVPFAFDGTISAPGQVDANRFTAKKGQPLTIQCFARRLRSPLDSVVDVYDATGKWLAGNDDANRADSLLSFTPPADAEYEVRIRDHLMRGGDHFVYRIEIDAPHPSLVVSLERIDSKRPQFLQAAPVPQGNRFAMLARAHRQDIAGPVALQLADLPPGITATTTGMDPDVSLAPILFEAAPNATLSGALAAIQSLIKGANGTSDIEGTFSQSIPLVIAAPNDTIYYQTNIDKLAVAVTEPAPFSVQLAPNAAPLTASGSKNLRVIVERAKGFTGEIILQMLWNPPGISSALNVKVPPTQSEAAYPINASPDAPLKTWKIAILARASINGGDIWVSTNLADLLVAAPFFAGTLQMAAAQQGKPAAVLCKLESKRPFEGKATVTLLGLPPNTSCPPKEIQATDKEIVFDVTLAPNSPIGQHSNLFCDLTIKQSGEDVTHRVASGGSLRIDAPPVAVAAAAAAPAPAQPSPPPAAPTPKPLSRLEQLRKAAAEKAIGSAK